jgi:hypothetical protein
MARFKKYTVETNDEWTDEVFPIMRGYKMACCDCGLVHNIEFDVFEIEEFNKDGSFKGNVREGKEWRVAMRVRRNNRSTGQMRRSMKGKNNDK